MTQKSKQVTDVSFLKNHLQQTVRSMYRHIKTLHELKMAENIVKTSTGFFSLDEELLKDKEVLENAPIGSLLYYCIYTISFKHKTYITYKLLSALTKVRTQL